MPIPSLLRAPGRRTDERTGPHRQHREGLGSILLDGVVAVGNLYGYIFFVRVAPSVMISELMRDFAVSGAILGNLSAVYFYAYAGMQIPLASCTTASGRGAC